MLAVLESDGFDATLSQDAMHSRIQGHADVGQ